MLRDSGAVAWNGKWWGEAVRGGFPPSWSFSSPPLPPTEQPCPHPKRYDAPLRHGYLRWSRRPYDSDTATDAGRQERPSTDAPTDG